MDQGHNIDAPAVQRRKRKVARQTRDKTPEPRSTSGGRKYSDDESSSTAAVDQINTRTKLNTVANNVAINSNSNNHQRYSDDGVGVQTIRMQIRPPGTMSAHESKILRRRNHGFANAAARSHSQPRSGEHDDSINSFKTSDLLQSPLRRSHSSTRHDELDMDLSSESTGQLSPKIIPQYSPLPDLHKKSITGNGDHIDGERIVKLEKNLRRFEEERMKFEMEKKKFDREKRELHKVRYRQMLENEERRRMLLNYRKLSGERSGMPSDSDEYRTQQRTTQSFREQRNFTPIVTEKSIKSNMKKYRDYETSSVSESDSDRVSRRRTAERENSANRRQSGNRQAEVLYENIRRRSSSRQQQAEDDYKDAVSRGESFNRRGPPERKSPTPPAPKQEIRRKSLSPLRQRKKSKTPDQLINETYHIEDSSMIKKDNLIAKPAKSSIFVKILSIFNRSSKNEELSKTTSTDISKNVDDQIPLRAFFSWSFIKPMIIEMRKEWIQLKADYPNAIRKIQIDRNKCFSHFIILALFIGFGGLMFRFTEGTFENIFKCEVRKVKRDFIDHLWTQSHSMREDDWKSTARTKLRKFEEELNTISDSGLRYTGMKSWNFLNSVIYCLTVITAVGYGHIAPQTTLGRSLTIGYAIIGIPMFLILLADFGKLFTRCIKFVWAYIRRVYYTGTCRKVRKNQQMQDMMKGINTVYDVAIRRPSQFIRDIDIENQDKKDKEAETPGTNLPSQVGTETPTSPYPETFEIDDEFNLPVSVASTILILYIIFGALIYALWEEWTYFESFYFVFISMSTIGFGDFVPNHPIFMMCTILYLLFGLALTSMFINVVQIKLSDSFKQASAKIGATIGLSLAEEELSRNSQMGTPVSEVPSVHLGKIPESSSPTDIAGDGGVYDNYQKNKNNDDEPPVLLPRSPRQPPQGQNEEETKRKKKFFNFK